MPPRNAQAINGSRYYRGVPGADRPLPSVTTVLDKGWVKPWMGPWAAKITAQTAAQFMEEADRLSYFSALQHSAVALVESSAVNAHVLTKAHKDETGECQFKPDAVTYLKGAPWRKRDAAGDHGTDAHGYLESRLKGEWAYDERTAGMRAIDDFLDTYNPEPLHIEFQCANLRVGYAGSGDIVVIIGGKRYLVDLKTSGYVSHDYRLQLAAYRYAEFIFDGDVVTRAMPAVDGTAILHVPRETPDAWQLVEVRAERPEFVHFQHALATFRFLENVKNAPVGQPIPAPAQEQMAA